MRKVCPCGWSGAQDERDLAYAGDGEWCLECPTCGRMERVNWLRGVPGNTWQLVGTPLASDTWFEPIRAVRSATTHGTTPLGAEAMHHADGLEAWGSSIQFGGCERRIQSAASASSRGTSYHARADDHRAQARRRPRGQRPCTQSARPRRYRRWLHRRLCRRDRADTCGLRG